MAETNSTIDAVNGVNNNILYQSLPKWIKQNEQYFLPPICNKMMHGDGQLKIMFVGGPNQRKDFHIEEGEEFFYMVKGDMNLVIQEMGRFKDVHIKEGEVFLLPARIPHSPQRIGDTVGLVIERERSLDEKDCLRYFVGDTTETLYERWFYCADLGVQLGPLITEYFASEEHRTGKPVPGKIYDSAPWAPDNKRKMDDPFLLSDWLKANKDEIDCKGHKYLFDPTVNQTDVIVFGNGSTTLTSSGDEETWLWQLEGSSEVEVNGKISRLEANGSLMIPAHSSFRHSRTKGSLTMSVVMNLKNKNRATF